MGYAVVIYPELKDPSKIQELRREYDPTFTVIAPHITLVFPTAQMDKHAVVNHVMDVLKDFAPFNIRLKGLTQSFDSWLFLCVEQGKERIIELHDRLYTGIFRKHLRTDIPYIPHIGLGLFQTETGFHAAERKARALNLMYESTVRSIHIIHLNDDQSQIDWTEELSL
jgi:2'-5' RNA ligase